MQGRETEQISKGSCLCGGVRYEVKGPLRDVVNCHCAMCQKVYGAFGAHTKARKVNITLTHTEGLAYYKTSDVARRGFCKNCGTSLFWDPYELDATGIAAGTLDTSPPLKTIGHIFVGEKAGFYEITDDNPQFEASSQGQLVDDYK